MTCLHVLTGATSGLGLAAARRLAERTGDRILVGARAPDRAAALRRRKDAWRRGCAGEAARTVPGPPPDICGWFANEETWRAPRCVPDMWAAWCAVSRRLPFVD